MSGVKKFIGMMMNNICLIAGEPSGDFLGAQLMRSLGPSFTFSGIGGGMMEAEGLQSWIPLSELSIMGIIETIPHLTRLYRYIKKTEEQILTTRPDLVITIDFPGFNFRLAKKLKGKGIPLIHYVAPTVWAWRPGRAKKIAQIYDHLMALFPFEPPYFQKEGLPTTFVGHPLMDQGLDQGNGMRFRKSYGIPETSPLLCVLPGSRPSEILRLLPIFCKTVRNLKSTFQNLEVVLPTLPHLLPLLHETTWDVPVHYVVSGKKDAYAASTAALAASGTIALELAAARLPMVIAYRVSPFSAWIARQLIQVNHVSMVNILLNKPVVPECLQDSCTPEILTPIVQNIMQHPDVQRKDLNQVVSLLKGAGPAPTIQHILSKKYNLLSTKHRKV